MHRLRWPAFSLLLLAACGGKEPPGTFKSDQFGFSLVAPEGWTRVIPGEESSILREHENRLLSFTRESFMNPVQGRNRLIVAFVKTDVPDPLLPVIGIVYNPVGLPEVGEAEKEKSRTEMRNKTAIWERAEEQSAEIMEVDGRKAVRIAYKGSVVQPVGLTRNTQRFELRSLEHMIPSKSLTHFVSYIADASAFDGHLPAVNQLLASFKSTGGR